MYSLWSVSLLQLSVEQRHRESGGWIFMKSVDPVSRLQSEDVLLELDMDPGSRHLPALL